jgi:hypothetical protein
MNRYQEFVMTGQLPHIYEISEVEDDKREQDKKDEKEYEKVIESSASASRLLRKVVRLIHDEWKRNVRNKEVYSYLSQAVAALRRFEQQIKDLEAAPGQRDADLAADAMHETLIDRSDKRFGLRMYEAMSHESFEHASNSFNAAMKNLRELSVHLNEEDDPQVRQTINKVMELLKGLSTYIDDKLEHEEGYESEQLNNMGRSDPYTRDTTYGE